MAYRTLMLIICNFLSKKKKKKKKKKEKKNESESTRLASQAVILKL